MNKRIVKKTIILGIIMLFVGTSVLPNINNVVRATSTITFYTNPPEGGTILFDATTTYSNGQSIQIENGDYSIVPEESSDYYFSHWTTTGGLTLLNPYSWWTIVSVSGSGTLTAWFTPFGEHMITLYEKAMDDGDMVFNGVIYTILPEGKSIGVDTGTYPIDAIPDFNHISAYWTSTGGLTVADPNSQSTTVSVSGPGTLTVWFVDAPFPEISPFYIDFGTQIPGWTGSQTFEIWNSGSGTVTYTLSESIPWITVNPTSGSSTGKYDIDIFTVNVIDTGGMSGYYCEYITYSYDGKSTSLEIWITINNPPNIPSNPTPAHLDTKVCACTNSLSWSGSDPDTGDTVTYDVYFGTTSPPPLADSGISETTWSPSEGLTSGTTYYWYIIATDNNGASTTGPEWQFTTTSPFSVTVALNGKKIEATITNNVGAKIKNVKVWMNFTITDDIAPCVTPYLTYGKATGGLVETPPTGSGKWSWGPGNIPATGKIVSVIINGGSANFDVTITVNSCDDPTGYKGIIQVTKQGYICGLTLC